MVLILLGVFFATTLVFARTPVTTEPTILDRLMLVLAGYAMGVAGALTQGIIICVDLAIRLMMYNGFVTSPVVGAGWAIVRDAMNMFFVIILIYIAVVTIFGKTKVNWMQAVPKMLIFAILINFSRTLCGIMIDISQVVMMIFANALRNVAAGNFIQMLGLNEIYLLSENSTVIQDVAEGTGAPVAFDWFAAGLLSVFMVVMVLAVILALVAILAWRIVTLWVLVAIAPLAWFMGGIAGVFSQASGYAEWWKRFVCATAIGPVLTFFLWLTLAVAGAGSLAARGGFVSTTEQGNLNLSGNMSSIFEVEHLISFVLGMGMLMAGFEAANSVCQGSSPFVQKALGKAKGIPAQLTAGLQKFATKQAKAAGGAAAGLGLKGARKLGAGVKAAGGRVGRDVGEWAGGKAGIKYFTKRGRAGLYRDVARKTRGGGIVSRALSKRADVWGEQLERARMGEVKEMGKGFEGMSTQSKVNELLRQAKGKTGTSKLRAQNLFMELAATEEGRRQLSLSGVTDDFWKKNGAEMNETFKNDPDAKGKLDAFKKARVDLSGKKWTDAVSTWSDVQAMDPEAMEALVKKHGIGDVQKHLESIGSDKKGVSAWQSLKGYEKDGNIVKSSNLNAQAILTGTSTARGIRFASASAQDLANVTDEDLVENVTEKGVGNEHIRNRLLRSRSVSRIKNAKAREALAESMLTSGAAEAGTALRANPILLGALGDKQMEKFTEDMQDKKTRAQMTAAIKADPKGNAQLQQNIARLLAMQVQNAGDDATKQSAQSHLNEFIAQSQSTHTAEATTLRDAGLALSHATGEKVQVEGNIKKHEQEKETLTQRKDSPKEGDEARLAQLEALLKSANKELTDIESKIQRLSTAHIAAQANHDKANAPVLMGMMQAERSSLEKVKTKIESDKTAPTNITEQTRLEAELQKVIGQIASLDEKMQALTSP
ncbi:MAG: hypothetical protein UX45_C0014G0018 [Candidatus Uhrbacteria bacterium GW2011_GWF2_46_218]|uniref:Uncharacterized protein n=1 Tax=Candidatus Uhrbacteria bacterium GW2011_GWF2_46_218 TaxID=1619001 RepID=A0A0G1PIX2_9BACT|nr:MAG: hypothetical protein UX45_C0014G0018 [Candidatus Uhrbacteria bacterium GW2011_GWF2_46_218]